MSHIFAFVGISLTTSLIPIIPDFQLDFTSFVINHFSSVLMTNNKGQVTKQRVAVSPILEKDRHPAAFSKSGNNLQ